MRFQDLPNSNVSRLFTIPMFFGMTVCLGSVIFAPFLDTFMTIALFIFAMFFSVGLIFSSVEITSNSESDYGFFDKASDQKEMQTNRDQLPIALLKIAPDGHIFEPNRAARTLLNIKDGESPHFSDLVEGMGRSVTQWVDSAKNRKSSQKTEMGTAKRRSKDVYLQIQIFLVEGDNGQETVALVSDATELKSLEAQFVQSQKMQAIGELAGGIAHDFNNLLTAISGYCDLLMLRHEKGDADYGDLVQISSNANRAAGLVGQLLAYSRKQSLKPSAVQVNETLADLTHLLNRLVGEKITLRFDQAKELPLAFVDDRQFEQVIMNLVVNARDAMPKGGEIQLKSRSVELKQDEIIHNVKVDAGNYVLICVEDQGVGIPKGSLDKIFEPFYSTKDVGKGTGLGLSMVYGIVKQTGGYIIANSDVGSGTTFSIYLPVSTMERPEIIIRDQARTVVSSNLSGLKVLLVEDESSVRAVSSRALEVQGVVLTTAVSGQDALNKIEEFHCSFDVVVSDVVMPDMDGPTWVKIALENGMKAKVIFVSGYAKESLSDQWEKMDDVLFLPKPYSLKKLISVVNEAAEMKR